MRLSRAGDYACRAILHLSIHQDAEDSQSIQEIARAQAIPVSFLRKIIPSLSKARLVRAIPGRGGGVVLMKPPSEISLRQVIEAVEGPIFLNLCLIGPGECPRDKVCPIHPFWREIQEQFVSLLDKYTFANFMEGASPFPRVPMSGISLM